LTENHKGINILWYYFFV